MWVEDVRNVDPLEQPWASRTFLSPSPSAGKHFNCSAHLCLNMTPRLLSLGSGQNQTFKDVILICGNLWRTFLTVFTFYSLINQSCSIHKEPNLTTSNLKLVERSPEKNVGGLLRSVHIRRFFMSQLYVCLGWTFCFAVTLWSGLGTETTWLVSKHHAVVKHAYLFTKNTTVCPSATRYNRYNKHVMWSYVWYRWQTTHRHLDASGVHSHTFPVDWQLQGFSALLNDTWAWCQGVQEIKPVTCYTTER